MIFFWGVDEIIYFLTKREQSSQNVTQFKSIFFFGCILKCHDLMHVYSFLIPSFHSLPITKSGYNVRERKFQVTYFYGTLIPFAWRLFFF